MSNTWDYVSGNSTIVADHRLQALVNSVILASDLEDEANQGVETATNNYSYKIEGDEAKAFVATIKIGGRAVYDEASGDTKLKPKNVFVDLLPDYAPGDGTLAGTANLSEGIVLLAKSCTYFERQVRASVVTKTPNQVTYEEKLESSQFDIALNIPVTVKLDRTTGKTEVLVDDYFYILGVQN